MIFETIYSIISDQKILLEWTAATIMLNRIISLKSRPRKRKGLLHYKTLKDFQEENTSVISSKGESQNRDNKKTKPAKFSEKRVFLTP